MAAGSPYQADAQRPVRIGNHRGRGCFRRDVQIRNAIRNRLESGSEDARQLDDLNLLIPRRRLLAPGNYFICDLSLREQVLKRRLGLNDQRERLFSNEPRVANELKSIAQTMQTPNDHASAVDGSSIPKAIPVRPAAR